MCPSSSTIDATLEAVPHVIVVLTSAGLSILYWAVVGEIEGCVPIAVIVKVAGSPRLKLIVNTTSSPISLSLLARYVLRMATSVPLTVRWLLVRVCPSSSTIDATDVAMPQVMVVSTSAGSSRSYWAVVDEIEG